MPLRLKKDDSPFKPAILFILSLFISIPAVFFGSWDVNAEQVTLAWDANTEANLAGYRIHLGTAVQAYNTTIDVGNQTRFTVTNLSRGTTYFFSVTAYNTQGQESDGRAPLDAAGPSIR